MILKLLYAFLGIGIQPVALLGLLSSLLDTDGLKLFLFKIISFKMVICYITTRCIRRRSASPEAPRCVLDQDTKQETH